MTLNPSQLLTDAIEKVREALAAYAKNGDQINGNEAYLAFRDVLLPHMTAILEATPEKNKRALSDLVDLFKRDDENSLEHFERVGEMFRAATGYLRPGKDSRLEDPEVRQAAWDKWYAEKISAARAALSHDGAKIPDGDAVGALKTLANMAREIGDGHAINNLEVTVLSALTAQATPANNENAKNVTCQDLASVRDNLVKEFNDLETNINAFNIYALFTRMRTVALSVLTSQATPAGEWQTIDTLPDPMNRPGRYWIEVEGFQEHSGRLWTRTWRTVVVSNPNELLGISVDDFDIIRKQGDFDVIEKATRWRPIEPAAPKAHNTGEAE